jgi:hypothetical protein
LYQLFNTQNFVSNNNHVLCHRFYVISFDSPNTVPFIFSTAAMYLRPAMGQAGDRLEVLTNTMVNRVIFAGRRAVGVELQTGGRHKPVQKIYAKEVHKCDGVL